jgi:hypothetical protein
VNGFVIEATWKRVVASQPTAAVSSVPPTETPVASAGTSHAIAAASQACKKAESNKIRYPTHRPGLGRARSSFAAS